MSELLRTPLYALHVARKARMVPFAGWEMPLQYTSIVEEHHAVRQQVGVFDISHMGRLFIAGSDSADLLEWLYTNAVATLQTGQVRYGLICNEHGGTKDDVLLYHLPAAAAGPTSTPEQPLVQAFPYLLVVNAANREKIVAWFQQHRGSRAVTLFDATLITAMLAVQGPHAVAMCERLLATTLSDLRYYFGRYVVYRGQTVLISRTGYTGEDGLEWVVPVELAQLLWNDLLALGAVPCGLGARDTLRLEAGMPLYGHELTEEIDPLQAGLEWAVKWQTKDFLGRAGLLQRQSDTTRPKRVGLELASRRIAREQCSVWQAGKCVGWITSGTFAPTLQKSIAMAYVAPELAVPGTAVEVDIRGHREAAQVVALPFYSRRKPARASTS
ncbi:MAG: glycine cleavage system aminomethyltransferase GcvT [Gemmatales bacterium]|nr:glycine cleavage system aminomethyltransferase GcvT [Gemmatales bacterium]